MDISFFGGGLPTDFYPWTIKRNDVTVTFTSKYDDLPDIHKAQINKIAIYKDDILQLSLDDPKATSFVDELEEKGSTLCYRLAFLAVPPLTAEDHEIKSAGLSNEKCFVVE